MEAVLYGSMPSNCYVLCTTLSRTAFLSTAKTYFPKLIQPLVSIPQVFPFSAVTSLTLLFFLYWSPCWIICESWTALLTFFLYVYGLLWFYSSWGNCQQFLESNFGFSLRNQDDFSEKLCLKLQREAENRVGSYYYTVMFIWKTINFCL